jgi:hypothetical protein
MYMPQGISHLNTCHVDRILKYNRNKTSFKIISNEWINVAQDRDKWRAVVNTMMNR